MVTKRNARFAMSKNEKIAHKRNLQRMLRQRQRKDRKNALSLVPPENLPLYTGHRLGKVVHSVFEEKSKARKRAKKQYGKILKNPRLLAEKKQKDPWRKRVYRVCHGCLNVEKRRNQMKLGFFLAPKVRENNWNQNQTEQHRILRSVNLEELIFNSGRL